MIFNSSWLGISKYHQNSVEWFSDIRFYFYVEYFVFCFLFFCIWNTLKREMSMSVYVIDFIESGDLRSSDPIITINLYVLLFNFSSGSTSEVRANYKNIHPLQRDELFHCPVSKPRTDGNEHPQREFLLS